MGSSLSLSKGLVLVAALAGSLVGRPAESHFLELIAGPDIVTSETGPRVVLDIRFSHPMENGPVMDMEPPRAFGVLARGTKTDLAETLKPRLRDGATAYGSVYEVRTGDHVFFLEPAPYWEPAEGKMILHYTKVVVDGFGMGGGWDAKVGFPVEIDPLVRPYGLWTGNLFRGIVRHHGEPLPFAEIEVEYRSEGTVTAPTPSHVTQVIKADGNGVFAYAMPRAGWWGFAALVDGEEAVPGPEGRPVPVELGGLIWVRVHDME